MQKTTKNLYLQNHQLIYNQHSEPAFAVIPFQEYEKIMAIVDQNLELPSRLLCNESLKVRLPNGGRGAAIDLIEMAHYCYSKGVKAIAIGARQQSLNKFKKDQLGALDPFLRMCFLPADSIYRNTMQATQEVVDALVETRLFNRRRIDINSPQQSQCFYRPVHALEVNTNELEDFVAKHPLEGRRSIPNFYWLERPYNKGL